MIKPNEKIYIGIMDLGRPTTKTEARELIGMVYYYINMGNRRSHISSPLEEAPLEEAARGP